MENPKRKKYSFFSSLYWKIAVVFLIALIIISVVYIYIAAFTAEMYYQEASQRLNQELAQHIAGLAPLAVRAMKKILQQAASGELDMDDARSLSQVCAESEDLQEGFAAQREKRKPQFKGR